MLGDSVGTFGGLTVQLPNRAHWIWLTIVLALAFPVLSYAWIYAAAASVSRDARCFRPCC